LTIGISVFINDIKKREKQSMFEMKATRDGYGEGLVALGERNPQVVVLSADLTDSTRASMFKKRFPERFFTMGVAEADMIGTAGGLSLVGKIPFCCSLGVFASGRVWDQVRITICYSNLNVKIGGSHGGISVGADGATHQSIEEITLMRVLPNMKVVVPCDAIETRKATIRAGEVWGPVYIRFGRPPIPVITTEDTPFLLGKAITMREGKDVAIFACGVMVYDALEAAKELDRKGISARVINLHTVKPIDEEIIFKAARETGAIVTAEEHQLSGGFGSAVAEVAVQQFPVPVEMVGIKDRFGQSGSPEELMQDFGLTRFDIIRAVERVLKRK
jgi:transketolase